MNKNLIDFLTNEKNVNIEKLNQVLREAIGVGDDLISVCNIFEALDHKSLVALVMIAMMDQRFELSRFISYLYAVTKHALPHEQW